MKQSLLKIIKNESHHMYGAFLEQKNAKGTKVVSGWRIGSPNGPLVENKLYYEFDTDQTYYAVWSDLVTIDFEYNGQKIAHYDNSEAWTTKNIYTIMVVENPFIQYFDDETFVGWFNKETGEKLTADTVIAKSCVFEARTEKRVVKVKLDYNGGSGELNEVTTMGGYLTNDMLNDPFIVPPKNKVFVGWSFEKDGKILGYESYDPYYIMNQNTTLYAKYADEAILTIHYNGETYIEKVPENEWMMFMHDGYCVIDGKTYYSAQSLKFTKDTDVYVYDSTSSSAVSVNYIDLTKHTGNGYGWSAANCFIKWHHFSYNVKEIPGKEVNIELDESFVPKGMVFDKWATIGGITIKNPTSKKTSFTMPKKEFGRIYEIYATYREKELPQFEKESVELVKGDRIALKVNGDYDKLTWSSSDPTTVQVDQNGNVHAVRSGEATISAMDTSGNKITCVVKVTNKLKALSLKDKKLELSGKTEKQLAVTLNPQDADPEKLHWSSDNESIVKVNNEGRIITASCGEATITVKSDSGLKDTCTITVKHDYNLKSKTEATDEKEGKIVYECSLCKKTKEEVIPKVIGIWKKDTKGWWYLHQNGSYTKNDFETIKGQTYYFDGNGYMVTGWKQVNKKWYYFNGSGYMLKKQWVGNYYFEEDGVMATNKWIGNYYVGADGKWIPNYK